MPILEKVFLKPIEDKITQCKSDNFIINLNYEIVIPDSGKSLLHCDYFSETAMKGLFDSLYKEKLKFLPNDIEVDAVIFIRRLKALSSFLKKIGEEAKPIARIITSIRGIDGTIKIEPITLRVFDDLRNPILSKPLMKPEVRNILNNFCQQREMEKQELLHHLNAVFY